MKKVFIIHGFEGTPNGAWRPWLMKELDKKDVYACALSMPTPEAPKLNEWIEEIKRFVDINKNDEIVLVGHSLGATSILRYLEQENTLPVSECVLVSGPIKKKKNEKIYEFLEKDFNFDLIKNKSKKFTVIHGDDDPYVSLNNAEDISKNLDCKLILIKEGKHLNGSAGFDTLPECLEVMIN